MKDQQASTTSSRHPSDTNTRSKRDFLKTQLIETEGLIELTGNHPVMLLGLLQRKAELTEAIKRHSTQI
jgi:hypothetical protein